MRLDEMPADSKRFGEIGVKVITRTSVCPLKAFISNRDKQMQMTSQVVGQLRKLNVTADKELKLEYFFYTNTAEKAKQLATEIGKMNYTVGHGVSASDKKLFIITGWTTKMKMADEVIVQWTKQMCELGYKFDCEFDGWRHYYNSIQRKLKGGRN